MSAHPQPRLTPEQYLQIERAAACKSEYYNGRMYAMAGGSYRNFQIIGNLTGGLHAALRQRPCSVGPNDLRLRIASSGLYTYPDVVVICGEPKFTDDRQDTLVNPSFIAEVLSPSTEAYDRGFKSAQYRTIESLQEYALVSQVEARVEVLRRQPGAGWVLVEFTGLKAVCDFASLKLQIKLADIYEKVVFTSEDVIPPRPPVS